jgi:hypothetical protein
MRAYVLSKTAKKKKKQKKRKKDSLHLKVNCLKIKHLMNMAKVWPTFLVSGALGISFLPNRALKH